MKKLFIISVLTLLIACSPEEVNYIEPVQTLPQKLGLDLDTTISDGTLFNIGVESAGAYTVKIFNLNKELLSKSKLNLEEGNTQLPFYTKSLGSQPLSVILISPDGSTIAETKIGIR